MSRLVQGIWSATVLQSYPLVKTLYADAGSGIVFNLSGKITIGNTTLPEGVIMLPVKSKTDNMVLAPDARLAGIRFHPAVGYNVMRQHYEKPTLLTPEKDHLHGLYQLFSELRMKHDEQSLIEALRLWSNQNLYEVNTIPGGLEKALELVGKVETMEELSERINLSQRQVERHFRSWMGMTPKFYQRILRTREAHRYLCLHKNANLADVASLFGYSDQAHMTREFKKIACITPGKT